jgi:hypothetical protein
MSRSINIDHIRNYSSKGVDIPSEWINETLNEKPPVEMKTCPTEETKASPTRDEKKPSEAKIEGDTGNKSKSNWRQFEAYRKNAPVESLSDLRGNQRIVAEYMCLKARETNQTINPSFTIPTGLMKRELKMKREILKNVIHRLKAKNFIVRTRMSEPKNKITYTLNSSVYYSFLDK